jgi:hypothetical protein
VGPGGAWGGKPAGGGGGGAGGGAPGRLAPDPKASGAHSVYRVNPRSGRIDNYQTFVPQSNPKNPNPWASELRFRGAGKQHFNSATKTWVKPPLVHDSTIPGGVRPAAPWEIPR